MIISMAEILMPSQISLKKVIFAKIGKLAMHGLNKLI